MPTASPTVLDRLLAGVDVARAALSAEATATAEQSPTPDDYQDDYLEAVIEDDYAVAHYFTAHLDGYVGWRWCVVLAALPDGPVTVSEVVLLPGTAALTAPQWVPWNERIRAGDLGPGDLLAAEPDDERLVEGHVDSGEPDVAEAALALGLGRSRLLSAQGRSDAAERWLAGEYGPDSPMARTTDYSCVTCGFFTPLAGALRAAFGVCTNEFAADGHVVHTNYGCGAHSSVPAPHGAGSPSFEPYDDGAIEVTATAPAVSDAAAAEPGPTPTADLSS